MATPEQVLQAFSAGSGQQATDMWEALGLILAALVLVWLAWVAGGVGERVLWGRAKPTEAVIYIARAAVLVMVLVFILAR